MHREIKYVFLLICFGMALAGCTATPFSADNPYKVDTVVQIPVDPTEEPAEPAPAETVEETAPPKETVPETTAETTGAKTTTSGKSSGGKSSSSGGKTSTSGSKNTSASSTKATEPPETQPPETETAVTEAPVTEPVETVPATEPPYDPSSYGVGSLEYAMLEQMNSHRAEAGLSAFSMDTRLCGIAGLRAKEASAFWSHTRPDGRDYTTALTDYGYGFGTAAESLFDAAGTADASEVVAKWVSSGAHAGSLLNGGFTTVGIGVCTAGGITYIAVLFVG